MRKHSFIGNILVGGISGAISVCALLLGVTIFSRAQFSLLQCATLCVMAFPLGWLIGALAGSAGALWNMDVKKPRGALFIALLLSFGGAWTLSLASDLLWRCLVPR